MMPHCFLILLQRNWHLKFGSDVFYAFCVQNLMMMMIVSSLNSSWRVNSSFAVVVIIFLFPCFTLIRHNA